MAIRVVGQLAEKAQQLLGGKNPTERRMKDLLDEVEQLRAEKAAGAFGTQSLDPPTLIGDMAAEEIHEGLTVQQRIEREMERPGQVVLTATVPSGMPGSGEPAPGEPELLLDPVTKMLLAKLESMQEQILELRKPTKEDVDKDIGAGKLPPPSIQPPPRGLAGLHELPVGKWVISPLGPKVNYKICGCGKCTPYRLNHYFCVICKSGPHHYQQRYPHFTKSWMAPGQVWGISHHCCSEPCRLTYLSAIGVVAGLNDHEPPRASGVPDDELEPLEPGQERPEPTRIVTAYGSD